MRHTTYPLLLLVFLFSSALQAKDDLPTIHYQVTESREVESDLLVASVNVQQSHSDAGAAFREVNEAVLKIIELAQQVEGVTLSSGGYHTSSRQYGKKGKRRVEWVVRQVLSMKTQHFPPLLNHLGEIQQAGGMVQSLNYTVSPDRKREIEDQLKVKAVSRFRARAADYAEAAGMGREEWKLLTLSIDGQQAEPMPMSRGMFAMESTQGISAPSGTNTLMATVSGAITLQKTEVGIEERIQTVTEKVVEQLKQ